MFAVPVIAAAEDTAGQVEEFVERKIKKKWKSKKKKKLEKK